MSYTIIKNFFIISIAFYICINLIDIKISHILRLFIHALLFAESIITFFTTKYLLLPYTPIIIFLYFATITISIHLPISLSLTITVLTYAISNISLSLTTLIPSLIFVILAQDKVLDLIVPLMCISGLIAFTFTHYLLKSKRIRKGFQSVYHSSFQTIGYLISIIIVCFISLVQFFNAASGSQLIYLAIIFVLIFIFLYWFQNQTKKYYLKKLRALELESLRQELAEKDAQIQKLQESNDSLARIIHRDNKIIPAMEAAVRDYLETINPDFISAAPASNGLMSENTTSDPFEKLRAHGLALSRQLSEMTQDRKGILTAYESQRNELPHTGSIGIDAVLSYMKDRAATLHVEYTVKLSAGFSSAVNNPVAEEDLVHLLSDLLENALIATQSCDKRAVFIQLGTLSDALSIEISDSGAAFDPPVYQDFGIRRHSTHSDNGGSGIGLMDIWKLKKKYSASLHIYEYTPDTELYTKKLSLVFDAKNHYLIRSYRAQEIVMLQARSDMYVLPLDS